MPAKPSDKVVTHRIELGRLERTEMRKFLALENKSQRLENFQRIGLTTAAVGIPISLAYGMYKIGSALGGFWNDFTAPDWVDPTHKIWTPENRKNFREANPTILEQALKGPEILWAILWQK